MDNNYEYSDLLIIENRLRYINGNQEKYTDDLILNNFSNFSKIIRSNVESAYDRLPDSAEDSYNELISYCMFIENKKISNTEIKECIRLLDIICKEMNNNQ